MEGKVPGRRGKCAAFAAQGRGAVKDDRIRKLERKIGEMTLDMDILREASKPYRPTDGRTSDE